MLQELLKEATKNHHDELEQLMFVGQIMDGSLTPQQYQTLLKANYLTHAYFEEYIYGNLSQSLQAELNIGERIKLTALLKDVEELLIPIPTYQPTIQPLQQPDLDDASLLGAMYVLEGATLGGHVIVKRLLVNAHLQQLDLNFNYYQVYGQELINKWKQFCQLLNTRVAPEDYDKAIQSATAMFNNIQFFAQLAAEQ
jgi:heme oxygenase